MRTIERESTQDSNENEKSVETGEKVLGKGTVQIILANIVLIVSGYTIHFGLGRILGPGEYGIFGVIISLLLLFENFFTRGFRDAVSKYVAEDHRNGIIVRDKALRLIALMSLTLCLLYFSGADLIAWMLNDADLAYYIRLSSLAVPVMAICSVYLGYLNGLSEFKALATSGCVRHIGRVSAIFLLVFAGFGLEGAILGYATGIFLCLLAASAFSRRKEKNYSIQIMASNRGAFDACTSGKSAFRDDPVTRKLVSFALPLVVFSGLMMLIRTLDMMFIKSMAEGDEIVGYYTSAWTISFTPFHIFLALSITLLPSISRSTSRDDLAQTREYITRSLRYLLLLTLPMAFFTSSASKEIIKLTYTSEYISAADPLAVLIFGIVFMTVFYIMATIIAASGQPRVSMIMALVLVPLSAVLNLILIPEHGMVGAAWATTISCLFGLCISGLFVWRKFGVLVSGISFLRILVASSLLYVIPYYIPVSGILLAIYGAVLFGLYLLILFVLGEINEEDREFIGRIVPFGR